MSEIKLLPCPFCGGEAKIYDVGRKTVSRFQIICRCGQAMTPAYQIKEDAIKQWNTRKPMERILTRLKEEKSDWNYDYNVPINNAIEIVKEEGGIE